MVSTFTITFQIALNDIPREMKTKASGHITVNTMHGLFQINRNVSKVGHQ